MHSEIEIKTTGGRSFLLYYFNGVRQREYNGNKLSLPIFPNRAKSETTKIKLLNKLKLEFEKALDKGWNPLLHETIEQAKPVSLETSIKDALDSRLNGSYSRTYKRDVKSVADKFLKFLSSAERKALPQKLSTNRILEFLNGFSSSNKNYMNKRQTLNVLLPGTIQKTPRKKCTEQLHEIYGREQIKPILAFLKSRYPKLHIVSLLAYGCFLRPHEESRLLQRKNFRDQKIYLSGDENKGKKVRVVHIPDYVYEELTPYINACGYSDYIFTGTSTALNYDYFKTQWTRAKKALLEMNLIEENQTLYSFRHSAAVYVYHKTKDVHILQKLLGHSDMIVTMKYLRGLGELNLEDQKQYMPEL